MNVDIVQYLRPDGRQENVTTKLPDSVRGLYREMQNAGCRFEAEVLTTGEVSITITSRGKCADDVVDIDIVILPNGPGIQEAMVDMLKRKAWSVVADQTQKVKP